MLQVLFVSPPITCLAFIKLAGRQQRPKTRTNTNLSLCPNVQLYLEERVSLITVARERQVI